MAATKARLLRRRAEWIDGKLLDDGTGPDRTRRDDGTWSNLIDNNGPEHTTAVIPFAVWQAR